jgi:hypothetical protein
MTVKVKVKNKIPQDQRLTLDAIHLKQIKHFQTLQKSIPQKKKEIAKIEEQIYKLDKEAETKKNDLNLYFDLMDQRRLLEINIQNIKKEIVEIEKNQSEEDYLLDVGHIMTQYYINRENHQSSTTLSSASSSSQAPNQQPVAKKSNKKSRDVFDLFDNYTDNSEKDPDSKDENLGENTDSSENNFNKSLRREQMSKLDIYNHVMSKIEEDFVPEDTNENFENDECPFCETDRELYQNEGKLVCPKCFYVDFILIDSDKPSYRDTPKEMTNFAYKRRNHFIEVLSQYQGRETTEIPEEVYVEILQELKKNRITKVSDLTNVKLRLILKKIEQNRYYEHIPFIIYQLTGLKPPPITSKIRKRLIEMFNDIQVPFAKYCPTERRNFLSYSYILYKFFELLELDEHLPYLNLLKSRDKLHQQDVIWEKICSDLRWEYIPSV